MTINGAEATRRSLDVYEVIDVFRDLRYVASGWPLQIAPGQTTAGGLSERPFEQLKAEPDYRSRHVLYGYIPLGTGKDQRISFAIDDPSELTWSVWVDRNNNNDLTDDGPPIRSEGTGRFAATLQVTMSVATAMGERQYPYQLWLWFAGPSDTSAAASLYRPMFYAVSHFAGHKRLDNEEYAVVAFERQHHDGVFEDGDVCIDLNRDGVCDDKTEIVGINHSLVINGRQYFVRANGGKR